MKNPRVTSVIRSKYVLLLKTHHDSQEGPIQMEEFCLSVFANADKADRESEIQPPDVALASRFYIAALFFDVLTQFHSGGQLPPDLEQKRKYAKYRTIQIRNRQPLEVVADQITISAPVVEPSTVIRPEPAKNAPAASKKPVATSSFQYADDAESPRSYNTKTSSPHSIDTSSAKRKLQQAISAIDFGDYATAAALSLEAAHLLGRN